MEEVLNKEGRFLSPSRRDSSIPKNIVSFKSRAKTTKLPNKDKIFIEEILKRNMEKTIKIFKSSIPSYFNRHFRKKKADDNYSLSNCETAKRISSPSQPLEIQTRSIPERISFPLNPIISLLHMSNGIELYRVMDPNYKFFVGSGNNDVLIRKILKLKPGWVKVFSPHSANLIWTDIKKSSIFDLVPKLSYVNKAKTQIEIFDNDILPKNEYVALATTATLNPLKVKIYNKLEGNSELTSKKKLFLNMTNYYKSINIDPFTYLPLTFHFVNGTKDTAFPIFLQKFKDFEEKSKQDPCLKNC